MPLTKLSKANIARARRAFRRLKASTRERIRDPKSYIFRVAWDFQKGRVRRYGHR